MEASTKFFRRPRILRRPRRARAAGEEAKGIRRGFYLLPNIITSGSLLMGFYAITESFKGEWFKACWAIFFATLFDGIDGRVARITKTSSAFGAQYDSLSDLVSFGVAPGIIMFNFALKHGFQPRLGWTIAFLFVVCGALRLARYNIRPTSSKMFFEGLPIPAAANLAVFTVLFTRHLGLMTSQLYSSIPNALTAFTMVLALLMVSTLPYYGFKDVALFRRHKFGTLVFAVVMLVVVFQEPEVTIFLFMTLYALSGIVVKYFQYRKKKEEPPAAEPQV